MASPDSFRKDFTHLPILLFQRNEGMAKVRYTKSRYPRPICGVASALPGMTLPPGPITIAIMAHCLRWISIISFLTPSTLSRNGHSPPVRSFSAAASLICREMSAAASSGDSPSAMCSVFMVSMSFGSRHAQAPRLPVESDRVRNVLSPIQESGALRIRDVTNVLKVPRESINALMQYLKRKHLVKKTGHEFNAPYSLTDEGHAALVEMTRRQAA
jgi:hypothetical protein